MDVTAQVAVLFLVVLVGTLCRRLGYLTDSVIHGITEIVINVALPALTLYNMQREFSQEVFAGFLLTLAGTILTILVCILGGWLLFKNRPHARRAVLANLCGFSNCGFMGYPIILAIHPDWMIYAVAYNIGYSLVSWTVGISVFGGRQAASLKRALLNPNIIASLVGFALFCLRWRWPDVLSDALSTVGGLTTPLSMLLIGPRICGIQPKDLKDKDYALISALRNVVLPLLVLLDSETASPACSGEGCPLPADRHAVGHAGGHAGGTLRRGRGLRFPRGGALHAGLHRHDPADGPAALTACQGGS